MSNRTFAAGNTNTKPAACNHQTQVQSLGDLLVRAETRATLAEARIRALEAQLAQLQLGAASGHGIPDAPSLVEAIQSARGIRPASTPAPVAASAAGEIPDPPSLTEAIQSARKAGAR